MPPAPVEEEEAKPKEMCPEMCPRSAAVLVFTTIKATKKHVLWIYVLFVAFLGRHIYVFDHNVQQIALI